MRAPVGGLFLGLDSSTQSLKAIAVDDDLRVVYENSANFDTELPAFGTRGGAHQHPDGVTVTSPPLMWVAALDLLLAKMAGDKFPFMKVVAIGGSGQQHGSVWLKRNARDVLRNLDAARPLSEQLEGVFSVDASPIWMDSSTGHQCRELEKALGGAQAVADLTGSRAYERFTGNQIAKIWQTRPRDYDNTDRIALVSSFMASLLTGDYAPIDLSDGSGMNLLGIRSRTWSPVALDHTAPGLGARLGAPVPSHSVVGVVQPYFANKYGFWRQCAVVAFSGDNPNSLAGLRLQRPGDVAISLGTSDTMFGSSSNPAPSGSEGHVFVSPIEPGAFMVMIVRKNGSLTREKVRDASAGGSWEDFNEAIARTPPGNDGCISLHVDQPEITPPLGRTGVYRLDGRDRVVSVFQPAAEVRAVVEGSFLSMRIHGAGIGLKPTSILATGGASANMEMVRVMSNVFGVPVLVGEQANSAALGAAYRARHGWACAAAGRFIPFDEALPGAAPFRRAAVPDPAAHAVYTAMLGRYERLEREAGV
ncbi:MAG: xylulokinase [bacterium]